MVSNHPNFELSQGFSFIEVIFSMAFLGLTFLLVMKQWQQIHHWFWLQNNQVLEQIVD